MILSQECIRDGADQENDAPKPGTGNTDFAQSRIDGGGCLHRLSGLLDFGLPLGRRQSRRRDSDNGTFGADPLDGAPIAFIAAVIADFQMKGTVAGRRLTRFYTFPAAVAQGLIDGILVIIVIGVLLVDFADDPPFESVLRARFPRREPHLIRLARDIVVRGAKLAVSALCEIVYSLHR